MISDGNYGEIYPTGLFQIIESLLPYQKPIYITENGVPDKEDRLRPSFLMTHLREIWRAISFCYPVMGYYHWSLVDNFEWDRGWTQRFGLIELNPETQERTWREAAVCTRTSAIAGASPVSRPKNTPLIFYKQSSAASTQKWSRANKGLSKPEFKTPWPQN